MFLGSCSRFILHCEIERGDTVRCSLKYHIPDSPIMQYFPRPLCTLAGYWQCPRSQESNTFIVLSSATLVLKHSPSAPPPCMLVIVTASPSINYSKVAETCAHVWPCLFFLHLLHTMQVWLTATCSSIFQKMALFH